MDNLITINYGSDQPTLSARELHEFLEVKTAFKDWFPRMCEYGFAEGTDYRSFLSDRSDGLPGKPRQDAEITISMAKELCMIQRNERGKQARQYFIAVEAAYNSPEKVMARALKMADAQLASLKGENKQLSDRIESDRPKVLFADSVAASKTSILIGELAKLIRQNGVEIGQNRLFEWMRRNGYLIRRLGSDYNMPTQRAMEMGLFRVKETSITHSDGSISVSKTVKVTGKGQQYFVNKFLAEREAAS